MDASIDLHGTISIALNDVLLSQMLSRAQLVQIVRVNDWHPWLTTPGDLP